VLLDEPLGALDKSLREEMQFEIRRLHRELGVTMMYVTHDQGEALTLSDRVAVFRGGRIRQLAAPRTLYEQPADAFVAGFVGENNRLTGQVLRMELEEALVRLDCGTVVLATAAVGVGPGSRCLVTIRPERVAVAALRAEEVGEGAVPARLEEAIFAGDHLRLRFSLGEGEATRSVVIAKRPAGAGLLPSPGGAAALAWNLGDAVAFPIED